MQRVVWCVPTMSLPHCSLFAKTGLAFSILESISIVTLAVRLLFMQSSLPVRRNTRQEALQATVPLILNLVRIIICRMTVRGIDRRMANPESSLERRLEHLDKLPLWWCFVNSIGIFQYYVLYATHCARAHDMLSVGVLAALSVVNLICACGWLSFIKAQYQGLPPPPLKVFMKGEPWQLRHPAQDSCPVCLGDFKDNDVIGELPCGHGFHHSCIEEWLQRRPQCPFRCQPKKKGEAKAPGHPGEAAK